MAILSIFLGFYGIFWGTPVIFLAIFGPFLAIFGLFLGYFWVIFLPPKNRFFDHFGGNRRQNLPRPAKSAEADTKSAGVGPKSAEAGQNLPRGGHAEPPRPRPASVPGGGAGGRGQAEPPPPRPPALPRPENRPLPTQNRLGWAQNRPRRSKLASAPPQPILTGLGRFWAYPSRF